LKFFDLDLFVLVFKSAPRWVFIKFVFGFEIISDFQNFNRDFVWKIRLIANFAECGSKPWKGYLITIRRPILSFFSWFAETRDRLIFPYKIAVKILKIANYFQTKNKFDENSTRCTFKYQNKQIQVKKFEPLSKIGKLGSFFDFHTKRSKLQNRGIQLLAVILGFGGWNFAGDIIMNHIIHFLLLQLDPKERVKFSNILLFTNYLTLYDLNFGTKFVELHCQIWLQSRD
jgi:hypothetical protein